MTKQYLLVDGDVVRYRCGFAAQKTRYAVAVDPGDPAEGRDAAQIFENAKEANAFMKEHDIPRSARTSFAEVEPVENALHSVKIMMQRIQEKYPDAELEVYFSCPTPDNWRTQIYSQYKANRPDRRPEHDAAIREYMESRYDVRREPDLEADDAISIRARALTSAGDTPIVATIDKDMDQIPGLHYNFVKDEEYDIDPEYGDFILQIQCIAGDSTDNIPGIPGMGVAKARKALGEGDAWDVYSGFYENDDMAMYHFLLNTALVLMPANREQIDHFSASIARQREVAFNEANYSG